MGYDMYLAAPDPAVAARTADLREAAFDVAAERDALPAGPDRDAAQARVSAAMDARWAADTNYHRLNMGGMRAVRDAMAELGLLAVDYPAHPPFPDPNDFGLTAEAVWDSDPEDLPADPEAPLTRFWAACNGVLAWSPPDEPGLPVHKLCSNDGWIVTPRDCEAVGALLGAARAADPDRVDAVVATCAAYLIDFTDWIAVAAGHGGFVVR